MTEIVGPVCVDRDDGERLYSVLVERFADARNRPFTLDFAGVVTLTSSFLNPAIGKLYGVFPAEMVDHELVCSGLDETDQALVDLVRDNAKRYYSRVRAAG